MACHLLKQLRTIRNIELTVIVLNERRLARELRAAGLSVQVVDESRHSFLQIANAIRKILAQHPPDILHAHRYKENLLAFLVSRFYPSVCLIATQHGLPETHDHSVSWSGRLKSKVNFFVLYRFFQKVVAVSEDIRTFFVNDLGFVAAHVAVIHNGIEVPPVVSGKAEGDSFVIGSSGRLFPVKDYPLMIRIAQKLANMGEICFVLAGDGPERGTLEKTIDESGLAARFVLMGHLEDMDSFYQGLDLYLNTSVHEGIPMTILEAMAWGLPVVAPSVGGIPEVIKDGVEGFLLSDRDPAQFAEKCRQLQRDAGLHERMGRAARNKVQSAFSAGAMAQQYEQIYRDLAADASNPRSALRETEASVEQRR
jgi:glycosyltransferase involved in cell wall biosynthesis